MSPTARTLAELRKLGYLPAVVEKFIPGARVRQDLYGIIDVLAIGCTGDYRHVLGVQACVTGDVSKRVAKILAAPATRTWLENSLRLEVWGWAKRGRRGKAKRWTLSVTPITLVDLLLAPRARDGVGA